MSNIHTIVLLQIAIVLIIIAWRIIAGRTGFNLFWQRQWARTVKSKMPLLVIAGVIMLAIVIPHAQEAYDEHNAERLRLKYERKAVALKNELTRRGLISVDWGLNFGRSQAEIAEAKRMSWQTKMRCLEIGREIVAEMNLVPSTPRLGEIHDLMLINDVCGVGRN